MLDGLNGQNSNASKHKVGIEELMRGAYGGLSVDTGGPNLDPSRRALVNDFVPVYIDTIGSGDNYIGYLDTGGNYLIKHDVITSNGNYRTTQFYFGSGGSGSLTTNWGNRTTLTYAQLDTLAL